MMTIRRAAGLGLLVLMSSCISPEQHRQLQLTMQAKDEQIADLIRTNKAYQEKHGAMAAEIERLGGIARKSEEVLAREAELVKLIANFKKSAANASFGTGKGGVSFIDTPEGPAIRVQGKVLFASGSDQLSTDGASTLQSVVEIIKSHPGMIRVVGHTDTDKINRSASRFKDNMDLSCARARTVLSYLAGAGVERAKMSVGGYGEYRPVDPSDKAKNRRVEIVLLHAAPAAKK